MQAAAQAQEVSQMEGQSVSVVRTLKNFPYLCGYSESHDKQEKCIREVHEWKTDFERQHREVLESIPHVDIDAFYKLWQDTQIAEWDRNEPLSAFIMGYMVRAKETLGEA